jgi:hypothetical protein
MFATGLSAAFRTPALQPACRHLIAASGCLHITNKQTLYTFHQFDFCDINEDEKRVQ